MYNMKILILTLEIPVDVPAWVEVPFLDVHRSFLLAAQKPACQFAATVLKPLMEPWQMRGRTMVAAIDTLWLPAVEVRERRRGPELSDRTWSVRETRVLEKSFL